MPAGRRDGNDLVLDVRVQPRASRSEIAGPHGERLRIRLQAPPVDGRANSALIEFIAAAFGLPRSRVVIEHGLRLQDAPPVPKQLQDVVGCA